MRSSLFQRLLMVSLSAMVLFVGGCRGNFNIPSSPTPPSPAILWNSAYVRSSSWSAGTAWSAGFSAGVTLSVDGLPESTALVTLSGAGGSVSLTYVGPVTTGGNVMAFYQYAWGGGGDAMVFPSPVPIGYQPGQNYTFTTVTSAGTASVTVQAPGGINIGTNTVTWTYEGNNDQVLVYNASATVFSTTGDANSPVAITIPNFVTNATSATVEQDVNAIPGAAPGSSFIISQRLAYSPL